MSLTTTDLQLSLAYKLGETSSPSDSTTINQRLEWMNQAYFSIARRKNWWWLEASDSSNTNTGSTTGYSEPTDLKEFIELQVDSHYYDEIPYIDNRLLYGNGTVVAPSFARSAKQYYRFGGKYYFLQTDDADASTHLIKYYKRIAKVASGATFLIPDEFLEALVCYAEGMYWMSITQQIKAQVPFQLFEEIVKEMTNEHNRRGASHKATSSIREPEDAYF
jgi:hypothetical protein